MWELSDRVSRAPGPEQMPWPACPLRSLQELALLLGLPVSLSPHSCLGLKLKGLHQTQRQHLTIIKAFSHPLPPLFPSKHPCGMERPGSIISFFKDEEIGLSTLFALKSDSRTRTGDLSTWVSYLLPVPLIDPALELERAIRVTTT